MINRVVIAGNLTRDPELRYTAGGTAVLNYCIAVNEPHQERDGPWGTVPNYFDCTTFGNRAQSLSQHLSKGMKVAVAGRLKWRQWDDDGIRRTKVYIVAEDVEFLSQRPQQGQVAQQPPQTAQDAPTDADIPFQEGWSL